MKTCAMTAVIASSLALGAGAARADSVVQTGVIPAASTDWTQTVLLSKFDTNGGLRSLVSVEWSVTGHITGHAEVESLDASPTTVTVHLGSYLSMSVGSLTLATMAPSESRVFNASAFDGQIDFQGPSGAIYSPVVASSLNTGVLSDPSPFLGLGQVGLTFEAIGTSWASGSGNLLVSIATDASIEYRVEYVYSEVPTPGAAALLAVAGLTGLRRRRV